MENDDWKKVYDRYYTPEEQQVWAAAKEKMETGFDHKAYIQMWADLAARIEAAFPLDPASPKAQEFLAEWNKLLEPFAEAATPNVLEGASRIWGNIKDWEGEVNQPISSRIVKFMSDVRAKKLFKRGKSHGLCE